MILYSLWVDVPEMARATFRTHVADKVLDFLEIAFVEGRYLPIGLAAYLLQIFAWPALFRVRRCKFLQLLLQ